jgi:hypothetical protein
MFKCKFGHTAVKIVIICVDVATSFAFCQHLLSFYLLLLFLLSLVPFFIFC